MKSLIVNALADAGISTDGLSDDELLEAYNKLKANQGPEDDDDEEGGGDDQGGDTDAITNAITQAIKPISDELKTLTAQVNAASEQAKEELVKVVVNSKKYPGIDEAAAELLPIETLKDMAANCGHAHGLPLTGNENNQGEGVQVPTEMPE